MDVIIRDRNGNTLERVTLEGDYDLVEAHESEDTGNLLVTVMRSYRDEDDEMTADAMRGQPGWSL